jgi:hypothetical protein
MSYKTLKLLEEKLKETQAELDRARLDEKAKVLASITRKWPDDDTTARYEPTDSDLQTFYGKKDYILPHARLEKKVSDIKQELIFERQSKILELLELLLRRFSVNL